MHLMPTEKITLFSSSKIKSVARRCSIKMLFLKVSQNLQENTLTCNFNQKRPSAGVFLQVLRVCKFLQVLEHIRTTASAKSDPD